MRQASRRAEERVPAACEGLEVVGENRLAIEATDEEVLNAGPAGSGKTLAWLVKLHRLCMGYPHAHCLIVRKTRKSLSESVLVTFERDVLGFTHPILTRHPNERDGRKKYKYPNGSEIHLGGIDNPEKILSSEWDFIYCPEATELELGDWETLLSRQRSGVVPHKQIVADCNPTTPLHWIYQRCTKTKVGNGRPLCRLFSSTHADNPYLWDAQKQDWTEAGATYIAKLDRNTGPRLARFRYGLWERAEGVVWDGWDANRHIIDPFRIPEQWPLYLAIDFGFTAPFVCQFWRHDVEADRIYLQREIYRTGILVEDHARAIAEQMANDAVTQVAGCVCDPADAEGRATLERHLNISTIGATKDTVLAGIQEVAERLTVAPDGLPRLLVLRNYLIGEADRTLESSGKPTCFADEVAGWVWDPECKRGERPVDKDNHGCDAARYFAKYLAAPGMREVASAVGPDIRGAGSWRGRYAR